MPSDHATEMAKDELTMFLVTLLIAGNETTRNALTGGMSQLIENPGERQKLLDNRRSSRRPSRRSCATSRRSSTSRARRRRTPCLRGRKIQKGEKILLMYPSANRDADVFTDPDAFKVDRDPNPHVAFGIGNHFCLGANLARMEIRVMLEEILNRMPDMEYSRRAAEDASVLAGALVHAYAGAIRADGLTPDTSADGAGGRSPICRGGRCRASRRGGRRSVPASCGWRSRRAAASSSGGRI